MTVGNEKARHPEGRRGLAYQPGLDGIRGLAVLMVVASHSGLAVNGNAGVTAFFVLSGYLITRILVAERQATGSIDLRGFYARRAKRLLPALGAVLVFVAVATTSDPRMPLWVAAAGAYFADFRATLGYGAMGPLFHTWSLSIEEQFYLLWPLALPFAVRRPWILAVLAVASFAELQLVPMAPDRFAAGPDTQAFGLLAGCLLGLIAIPRSRLVAYAGAAVLVIGALVLFSVREQGPIVYVPAIVGSIALVAGGGIAVRPLVALGKISYGLYLWHFPLIVILPVANWIAALIAFPVALASYRWIERPFLRPSGEIHRRAPLPDPHRAGALP